VVSAGDGHGDGPADAELAADVVGRALHALEPDEEGRVAEHLRECAVCRALLAEAHETMAALAHALPSQEPPPTLRARILAAAAAEPDPPAPSGGREPARPTPPERPVGPAPVPREDAAGPRTAPTPAVPRRRTAAVLVLAAVIAGIVVFAARGAVAPGPGDSRAVVAQRAEQVVASAEARDPSVRSASLVQPGSGTVAAVVLDDASGPRVVPLAMPTVGTGRTFVLWRVAGSAVTPVGAMDPTGSFTPMPAAPGGTTAAPAPTRLAYALSVEAAGTVPTRPSSVVASGPLV
jgi:anti-sigma-K factor RskA